nr:MAG TPA: Protein of unknown function (DUF493) [Caudoviricetes sp.]
MQYPVSCEYFLKVSGTDESELREDLKGLLSDVCDLINRAYNEGLEAGKKVSAV